MFKILYDLRSAAVVNGCKVAGSLKQALVVPDSGLVKQQAEAEGLDIIGNLIFNLGMGVTRRCSRASSLLQAPP